LFSLRFSALQVAPLLMFILAEFACPSNVVLEPLEPLITRFPAFTSALILEPEVTLILAAFETVNFPFTNDPEDASMSRLFSLTEFTVLKFAPEDVLIWFIFGEDTFTLKFLNLIFLLPFVSI